MKKILKRNQVIIAALAIMIVVAGYLNMMDNPAENTVSGQKKPSVTPGIEADGTTGDIFTVGDGGELVNDDKEDDSNLETGTGENGDSTDVESGTQGDVTTGTGGVKDDAPGSAVLADTKLPADFFTGAKLGREQIRAQNKETLMNIVNDASISEELKKDAISALVAMTENAELEDVTESLLEAKGFTDVVVHIDGESVDVIVNAAALTEAQTAQIEDVVMRKTNIGAKGIVITHAVMED